MLKINNLNVKINDKNILENINFEVRKWEIFWLLWHNGSGKTTLLKAVIWLTESNGEIFFNGENIENLKVEERANKWIGYIMQEVPEYVWISIFMYVKAILKDNFDEKKLEEYFDLFGLNWDTYKNRNLDTHLSGGEKKKVEIITNFMMNKEVYLLDEIETALDATSRQILINIIKQKKENWTSFIIVSHNQDLINLSDNGLLLCNGKVQKAGKIEELNKLYLWKCEDCPLPNNCK